MFQLQGRVLELQLQHRHADGSWAEMEAADHDRASSDPERGEGVRVSHAADEPFPGASN